MYTDIDRDQNIIKEYAIKIYNLQKPTIRLDSLLQEALMLQRVLYPFLLSTDVFIKIYGYLLIEPIMYISNEINCSSLLKIQQYFHQHPTFDHDEYNKRINKFTYSDNKVEFMKMLYALYLQMISCIYYLHVNRIYHMDIKPENFLIDHEGYIILCDYELASCYRESNILPDCLRKEQCSDDCYKQDTTCSCDIGSALPLCENTVVENIRGSPHYISPRIATNNHCESYVGDYWAVLYTFIQLLSAKWLCELNGSRNQFCKEDMNLLNFERIKTEMFANYTDQDPWIQDFVNNLLKRMENILKGEYDNIIPEELPYKFLDCFINYEDDTTKAFNGIPIENHGIPIDNHLNRIQSLHNTEKIKPKSVLRQEVIQSLSDCCNFTMSEALLTKSNLQRIFNIPHIRTEPIETKSGVNLYPVIRNDPESNINYNNEWYAVMLLAINGEASFS